PDRPSPGSLSLATLSRAAGEGFVPASADGDAVRLQSVFADQRLAHRVDIGEATLHQLEHGSVAGGADAQAAEVAAAERAGRRCRRHADRRWQRHAEADELRHGYEVVVGRAVDAEDMDVAADDVGQEAMLDHR